METIGLFPLSTVIFPESAIPLHVFEERYKKLINDCLRENTVFGINLNFNGKFSQIGCSVDIIDVINKYDDGKMDIIVGGRQRFKINSLIDGKAYHRANIEFFDDNKEELNQALFDKTLQTFNYFAEKITTIKIEKTSAQEIKGRRLSYHIAPKTGLSVDQKQDLLELRSENDRLLYLLNHMEGLLPLLEEAETITKIVMYDGYYDPRKFKI